jgi:hypothetical protein
MSDIHIITGDEGGQWQAVMHLPVPAGNNSAGVAWSAAILNSGIGLLDSGRRTALVVGIGTNGTITAAEEAELNAGTLFEVVREFRVDTAGNTNPLRNAALDLLYAATLADQQAALAKRLKWFGYTRDVP